MPSGFTFISSSQVQTDVQAFSIYLTSLTVQQVFIGQTVYIMADDLRSMGLAHITRKETTFIGDAHNVWNINTDNATLYRHTMYGIVNNDIQIIDEQTLETLNTSYFHGQPDLLMTVKREPVTNVKEGDFIVEHWLSAIDYVSLITSEINQNNEIIILGSDIYSTGFSIEDIVTVVNLERLGG
jgi:hypothetical protein